MRKVSTGRRTIWVDRTVMQIATIRTEQIDRLSDRQLFMDTFTRVRSVAPALSCKPGSLETACDRLSRKGAVTEAAMIEALASLRAEGVPL